MLLQMAAVMFFNEQWHARAQGCGKFAVGSSPEEAMARALELRDGPNADLF